MTGEVVIDLVSEDPGDYSGRLKKWKKTEDGKKPVIKPVNTGLLHSILARLGLKDEEYPYALEDKHAKRLGKGNPDWIFLKPDREISGYGKADLERSAWDELESRAAEDRENMKEEKNFWKQLAKKRKRKIREEGLLEEEEQYDIDTGKVTILECENGHRHGQTAWNESGGVCPTCGSQEADEL